MSSPHSARIEKLRELIRHTERPQARPRLRAEGLPTGLPQGSIVELTGEARLEWLVRFLAGNPELRLAWLEEKLTLFPTAIAQRNVDLSRLLFVEASEGRLLWSARQVLASQLFGGVALVGDGFPDRELKRLQMGCEKSGGVVFLIPWEEAAQAHWSISARLRVIGSPGALNVEVLRWKGGS